MIIDFFLILLRRLRCCCRCHCLAITLDAALRRLMPMPCHLATSFTLGWVTLMLPLAASIGLPFGYRLIYWLRAHFHTPPLRLFSSAIGRLISSSLLGLRLGCHAADCLSIDAATLPLYRYADYLGWAFSPAGADADAAKLINIIGPPRWASLGFSRLGYASSLRQLFPGPPLDGFDAISIRHGLICWASGCRRCRLSISHFLRLNISPITPLPGLISLLLR